MMASGRAGSALLVPLPDAVVAETCDLPACGPSEELLPGLVAGVPSVLPAAEAASLTSRRS